MTELILGLLLLLCAPLIPLAFKLGVERGTRDARRQEAAIRLKIDRYRESKFENPLEEIMALEDEELLKQFILAGITLGRTGEPTPEQERAEEEEAARVLDAAMALRMQQEFYRGLQQAGYQGPSQQLVSNAPSSVLGGILGGIV